MLLIDIKKDRDSTDFNAYFRILQNVNLQNLWKISPCLIENYSVQQSWASNRVLNSILNFKILAKIMHLAFTLMLSRKMVLTVIFDIWWKASFLSTAVIFLTLKVFFCQNTPGVWNKKFQFFSIFPFYFLQRWITLFLD